VLDHRKRWRMSNSGLRTPGAYPDRAETWEQVHYHRRCMDVVGLVTPDIIEEHRGNPFGYRVHHSLALQRLDRALKTYPAAGRRLVPLLGDDGRWRIAQIRRDGDPIALEEPVCAALEDAVHQVFLMRVKALSEYVEGNP
jgi:hypothetical protein